MEDRRLKIENRRWKFFPPSPFSPLPSGFTFVEMLVVVALFAIVGTILFSSFSAGLKVWKRSTSFNIGERKAMLGLERLSRELRQACNYSSIGFWGEPGSVNFANTFQDKIWNISYIYNNGKSSIDRVSSFRQESPVWSENLSKTIIPFVKEWTLSYYGYDSEIKNLSFLESWNYTKSGIPKAIKVKVVSENGKIFEKIISIQRGQ